MDGIFSDLHDELKRSVSDCQSGNLALSGGLDSSIIAYFLRGRKTDAVTIIAEDFIASDLTYCQLVAKEFGLPSHIESVRTDKILGAAEQTIKILGNFNDMEVRNSVVMYLAIKFFKDQGKTDLITGDGADELFAGYNFFLSKSREEIDSEQKRIQGIMHFPSHVIGEHLGVRIESPFLSEGMMRLAGSIPAEYKVRQEGGTTYGKWVLRKAFEEKIPKKIAWRQKAAMQDGSGTGGLTELFNSVMSDEAFEAEKEEIAKTDEVVLRTKESMHYYKTYRRFFGAPPKSESENACPYCGSLVGASSKFCNMCGAYPI